MKMREILNLLTENPIDDISKIGDWSKNSSFGQTDRAILNSEKGVQKIKTKWSKCPFHFNVVLVNNKKLADTYTEAGEVTMPWLQKTMPFVADDPEFKVSENAITMIYLSNRGDERVQVSGWILAHRLGHALSRFQKVPEFYEAKNFMHQMFASILECYGVRNPPESNAQLGNIRIDDYNKFRVIEKELVAFYEAIGTMKSARENRIRNEFEFILELLAQYIVTGNIKFNPLPKNYKVGRYSRSFQGTDMDYKHFNYSLEDTAEGLVNFFETMLSYCEGRIFIC